jgi:hypothetical protein
MNEANGHVLVGIPYQGNAWWLLMALLIATIFLSSLFNMWRDRQAGLPVDLQAIIVKALIFLMVMILPVSQIFSHRW